MLLSALIDLFGDYGLFKKIPILSQILPGCEKVSAEIRDIRVDGLRAKQLSVNYVDHRTSRSKPELEEAAVTFAKKLGLSQEGIELVSRVLETLFKAEAEAHGEPIEEVHLHEAGSPDTIIDIVGAVYILERAGLSREEIYGTPLAIGRGPIKFSHGVAQAPVPAVVQILKATGYPVIGRAIETEISTPTGVALLVNLVGRVIHTYPLMRIKGIGYGAGTRKIRDYPRILRVVLGERLSEEHTDSIAVVETTVDDAPGEFLGRAVGELMEAGALDVSIIPAVGKKNRPSHIIKVLCPEDQVSKIARTLMKETGTLGVRVYTVSRIKLSRETRIVKVPLRGREYAVRVKIAKDFQGNILGFKPEYEDVDRIARVTGTPFRMLWLLAISHACKELGTH